MAQPLRLRGRTPKLISARNFLAETAIGFATSRAHWMKSCTTGLMVRFFKVMIPTGLCVVGNSTGNRLIAGLLAENFNTELGMIVRKRPVASSALRTGTVDVMIVVGGR